MRGRFYRKSVAAVIYVVVVLLIVQVRLDHLDSPHSLDHHYHHASLSNLLHFGGNEGQCLDLDYRSVESPFESVMKDCG